MRNSTGLKMCVSLLSRVFEENFTSLNRVTSEKDAERVVVFT